MGNNAKLRFQGLLFIGCQTRAGIGQCNRLLIAERRYRSLDLMRRKVFLGCENLERKCTSDGLRFARLTPCKVQGDSVPCIGDLCLMGLPKDILHNTGVIVPASTSALGGARGLMSEYGAAFRPCRTPRHLSRFLLSRK